MGHLKGDLKEVREGARRVSRGRRKNQFQVSWKVSGAWRRAVGWSGVGKGQGEEMRSER